MTTGLISIKYDGQKGNFNPSAKPDLAVANDNEIYYTNGMENKVYLVQDGVRSDYVWDNGTSSTAEGAFKNTYPLLYPSSITYKPSGPYLYFAERDRGRIKSVSMGVGRVYTIAGSSPGTVFFEGIDPVVMTLILPIMFEGDRLFGNFFLRERDIHRILIYRPTNNVYTLAGTGTAGYSGDGLAATSAALNNPNAVAVDSRGNVYVADSGNHALRVVIGGALP
jgi:sugar lactone lactonase YvrE